MGMHNWSQEWLRYIQQVNEYLQYQNQQIQHMNARISELEKDVGEQKKSNRQPPVINNNYHFDLLKIERLEGTLNIGLNPNANDKDSSIQEFAVGQSMQVPPGTEQYSPMYQGIHEQVQQYLNSDAYKSLEQMERKYHYPLDESYRNFIVEDVKKQIDERILYYMQKHPEEMENKEQSIIEEVKRDVEKTFEVFIQNLPRRENET